MEQFSEHRDRLRSVAYRMLGSHSDAEDAVQEAWLRLNRTDASTIGNLGGWLTTVVGRICLDMLRSRVAKREEPIGAHLPDPIVTGPEQEAELADSVGLALLIVLDALSPAERLAFVLHDMFGVPFDEIGRIVDRSPDAAKMMASRARRRVRGAEPEPDADPARRREVVDAFLAAARGGDFEALVSVLHPEVVLRTGDLVVTGAATVAGRAITFARMADWARPVLVNGSPGLQSDFSVMAFSVMNGVITEITAWQTPRSGPGSR